MAKINYFPNTHKSDPGVTFTLEKSEEIAALIQMANALLFQIDLDYLKAAAKQTRKQSGLYDAMMPLNMKWDEYGSSLLDKQADALEALYGYITKNKDIDSLRAGMAESTAKKTEIDQIFFPNNK